MLSKIKEDYSNVPKTIYYNITKRLVALADEYCACKDPEWAYMFAMYVPGADLGKCQEAACKDPEWVYVFAKDILEADIGRC